MSLLEVNEIHLTAHLPISPEKYKEFHKATAEDRVMQAIKDAVYEGWPKSKATAQAEIKPYRVSKCQVCAQHQKHKPMQRAHDK